MSEPLQSWYVLLGEQQSGPYTAEELASAAAAGSINPETLVWTEGLETWIPAGNVEGLFAAAAPASLPPPSIQVAQPPQRPAVAAPSQMLAPAPVQPVVGPGEYPPADVAPTSFPMVAGFLVGGLVFYALAIFLAGNAANEPARRDQAVIVIPMLLGVGAISLVTATVIQCMYLFRAWKCLRFGGPRTTPGKAVGLLFVPFFNYYWTFVAWYGLARDWNRIASQFTDLRNAPRLPEGLFLALCICAIGFPPAAVVLWFPVMGAICRGVNFMAYRPTRHSGMFTLG